MGIIKRTNNYSLKGRVLVQVRVGEGENIEQALRRFRKKVQKAGILADFKRRKFFEAPSERRKRKQAAAQKRRRKKGY